MDGDTEKFITVTGASRDVATKYLQSSGGDLDLAVAMFLSEEDGGGEMEPDMAPAAQGRAAQEALAAETLPDIDSIIDGLEAPRDDEGKGKGASKGAGKGAGKGAASDGRTVIIVFFADGFMVDEDYEAPELEKADEPAAPAPRRTGMMSLNDLKKESGGRRGPLPPIPKLQPLRSYSTPENKAFIDLVKAGRLPTELQRRDEAGEPIPVSIGIEDARPKTYAELSKIIKEMEKMKEQEEGEKGAGSKPAVASTLFVGAGNTCSGGNSSSAASGAGGSGGGGGGAGADPALVVIISAGSPPVADESKPCTAIQLRLASGTRVKVRMNLDHTVADIWRHVAAQMGHDAFKAASNHQLVAGFPPKPLVDPSVTLAVADLANAAVNHKC